MDEIFDVLARWVDRIRPRWLRYVMTALLLLLFAAFIWINASVWW